MSFNMGTFSHYLEIAAKNDNIEEKRRDILELIKDADDDGLIELGHYILGDLGEYGDSDEDTNIDQLFDDLIENIKSLKSNSYINKIWDELKRNKLL